MSHCTVDAITANLWRENRHIKKDLAFLARQRAVVVGTNESKNFLDEIYRVEGYQVFTGPYNGPSQQNTVWLRRDAEYLHHGAQKMCDAVGISPERWAVWVAFVWRGKQIAFIETHMNSHVDHAGRPYNLPRVGQYIRHMRALKRLVRKLRARGFEVIVGGDLNWHWKAGAVQWTHSPAATLRRMGLRPQWAVRSGLRVGSHGRRKIDYLAANPDSMTVHGQQMYRGHSDHRWPHVQWEFRRPR